MASKNTAALAGEFLVAGELSGKGYPVSITMGNAKAIDIYATAQNAVTIRVDVKASRYKTSWPVGRVEESLYYIFVSLQTEDETSKNTPPEYFIISGKEILDKKLLTEWENMSGIKYTALNTKTTRDDKEEWDCKERWGKLPPP